MSTENKTDTNGRSKIKNFALRFMGESILIIVGLTLINVISQFIIYPVWNRVLGNEVYGKILFMLSWMNILAVTVGMACNYGRMKMSVDSKTHNGIYNRILGAVSAAAVPYTAVVCFLSDAEYFTLLNIALMSLLTILTMWRMYADVEYRLSLNYTGCFLYYLAIGCGYLVGIGLFLATEIWQLALIPGEAAGLFIVWKNGSVLRPDKAPDTSGTASLVIRSVIALISTDLISTVIFNGDRILLNFAASATAVTIYYQASLMGRTMSLVTGPLNSVLIGYLAKYKQDLSYKFMHLVSLATLLLFAAAAFAATIAAHLLILILYPQNYALVRDYFVLATAAQVAGAVSGIVTNVLLRFCNVRYVLYVNIVFAMAFVAICIPSTLIGGLWGFSIAFAVVCLLRILYGLWLGYYSVFKHKKTA